MGELSELMQEGAVCVACGEDFLEEGPGYPRSCSPECATSSGVGMDGEEGPCSQWEYLVAPEPVSSADSSDVNQAMKVDPAFIQPWLNEKGKEGWELTSIVDTPRGLVYFFKREFFGEE